MRRTLIGLAFCAFTLPAGAQLTTTYSGTRLVGDKEVPATAQFMVENGRVAAIMTGGSGGRMIYDAKAEVLHVISDEQKSYFDITKAGTASGDPTGMMSEMQKQLEKMPKEQRAAAQQMMQNMMGSVATAAPHLTYVWSTETKTIDGYECTRVDGMRGPEKVTEYCGSKSNDFKMSDAERQTMLEMQGYLRNFGIKVQSNDEARAFQWDTSVDGYPVQTRCYRDGRMTLDLALGSVSHNAIPDEVFELPRGYKKMDFSGTPGAR